jgi:hypothetical protein
MFNDLYNISPTAASMYRARQGMGAGAGGQSAKRGSIGSSLRSPSLAHSRPRSSLGFTPSTPMNSNSNSSAILIPVPLQARRSISSDDGTAITGLPLSSSLLEGMGALYGVAASEVIQSATQRRVAITSATISSSSSSFNVPLSPLPIITRHTSGSGSGRVGTPPSSDDVSTTTFESRPRAGASASGITSSLSSNVAITDNDAVVATSWMM